MKIVLITHYFSTHRGGVEIVAGSVAERLVRGGGFEINWIASNTDPAPEPIEGLHCLPVKTWNFTETRLGIPFPLPYPSALLTLLQALKTADFVHIHEYEYITSLAAFFFARVQNKRVLITQHVGMIPYKNIFLRGLLAFIHQTFGRYVLRNATQVVFISEVARNYFSKIVRYRTAPQLIPNGVDLELFTPADEERRKKIRGEKRLPGNRPVCLFVGRFVEKKGLHILKQLAAEIPDAHWIFAGWGPINPEAWQLPNVTVFRELSGKTLVPLYQTADVLVLPSKGEGFPLVVQEAMACGTPAMVGPETALAYRAASPLLFAEEAESPQAGSRWVKKMSALLREPDRLLKMRPQVAALAREHWSWEKCAAAYRHTFQ